MGTVKKEAHSTHILRFDEILKIKLLV